MNIVTWIRSVIDREASLSAMPLVTDLSDVYPVDGQCFTVTLLRTE